MKKGGEDIELEIKSIGSLVLWFFGRIFLKYVVRKLEEPILAMVLIYISN